MVDFHPDFKVVKGDYGIAPQNVAGTDYPNYNSVVIKKDVHQLDVINGHSINLKTPDKTDCYEIPIAIHESKTGKSKDKLFMEIID